MAEVAWLFPWAKFLLFRDRKTPEKGNFLPAVFPLEKPSNVLQCKTHRKSETFP
jgi:hypothetical protein